MIWLVTAFTLAHQQDRKAVTTSIMDLLQANWDTQSNQALERMLLNFYHSKRTIYRQSCNHCARIVPLVMAGLLTMYQYLHCKFRRFWDKLFLLRLLLPLLLVLLSHINLLGHISLLGLLDLLGLLGLFGILSLLAPLSLSGLPGFPSLPSLFSFLSLFGLPVLFGLFISILLLISKETYSQSLWCMVKS